jgi:hypothetical protein
LKKDENRIVVAHQLLVPSMAMNHKDPSLEVASNAVPPYRQNLFDSEKRISLKLDRGPEDFVAGKPVTSARPGPN